VKEGALLPLSGPVWTFNHLQPAKSFAKSCASFRVLRQCGTVSPSAEETVIFHFFLVGSLVIVTFRGPVSTSRWLGPLLMNSVTISFSFCLGG
jgi:hypothetical protein